MNNPSNILLESIGYREQGNIGQCLETLRHGLEMFPDFKDEFGHDAFGKEIIRSLLDSGRFADAFHEFELLEIDIKTHILLICRVFMKYTAEAARAWFIKAAEILPQNPEVRLYFEYNPLCPKIPSCKLS